MSDKNKQVDPIPEEFSSYEEAAEFWDTHDTTDYSETFQTVEMRAELRQRHHEVEIEEEVMRVLRERAQNSGIPVGRLVSEMLRQQLTSSK